MHLSGLLHKTFEKELPKVHKIRLRSLMDISSTAMRSNKLYLTGLGRELSNNNKTSSNIEKVNRLIGNGILLAERDDFYKVMISRLLQKGACPWVHVDWTCINAITNLYALRASISMAGRSMVIYEECYPKKKENNHAVHKAFLNRLRSLLPKEVKPIIVTDAGFRAPWFAYILELGWNFVGRLRNKNLVLMDGADNWELSASYYEQARGKPTCLGRGLLTEEGKVPAHLVLYKGKSKGRHQLNVNKKASNSGKSKRHAKANKEPWLLVSSLSEARENPVCIVNIYRQRMRIEENIRDTKCAHYGLGLKKSLTQSAERMSILLLIAAIATFGAWLAGLFIKASGKAADFQAHSAKFTSVLSTVFLGREALKKGLHIEEKQFNNALQTLYQLTLQTQMEQYECV